MTRTFAEINLNSIKHNLKEIKKIVGKENEILLPVKADGYGHGIIEVSKFVSENKLVNMLGVASMDEAIELRKNKITLPILILSLIIPEEQTIVDGITNNITFTIADTETAKKISELATKLNRETKIHLKIDTGMGRIGCQSTETLKIAQSIIFLHNVTLEGIYTHLPVADEPNSNFTETQIKQFENILNELKLNGIKPRYKHILNSAGILNYESKESNMVRPGLISYGYSPMKQEILDIKLKPAMSLKSKIVFCKTVKKGTALSYGHTYTTETDTNIATIPIGYGDGYSRALSNNGKVLINNKQYQIVGRVSMDQILINLGSDNYHIGTEVTLFGENKITASTIAKWAKTIPYETTCNISKRVPRIYIEKKKPKATPLPIQKKQPKGAAMKTLEIFTEEQPEIIDKIILFDADTLEDAGQILVDGDHWEFKDVDNDHMIEITKNMKIRAVMSNLMMFNYVFDIITKPYIKKKD